MANVSSSNSQGVRVPKLRFPGFEGEWEESSFAEVFSFLSNNTLSRAELSDEGKIKNIHYGDVLVKFSDVIDANNTNIPFVRSEVALKKSPDYLQTGDVIVADTAEDDTVGKATEILNTNNIPVVSGLHTIPCRPNFPFVPSYLGYYLNSKPFHEQLYPFMQGIKVTSISKTNIRKTRISYPESIEQSKIAKILNLISERIEKQRQLVEALKSYKRGFLNSYISQNEQSWEKVCLSDILSERKEYCEKDGTYPHATLSKEGVYGKSDRYDRDYLVSSDNKKYKVTHKGDLCYNPANLKFGVICINTFGDAIFSPIYITFEISEHHNTEFVGAYLMRADFINQALRFQEGTVYERMAVSPDDLLEMSIHLPPKSEQDKFAEGLFQIQVKIQAEEDVLNKTVLLKKALLSLLFI